MQPTEKGLGKYNFLLKRLFSILNSVCLLFYPHHTVMKSMMEWNSISYVDWGFGSPKEKVRMGCTVMQLWWVLPIQGYTLWYCSKHLLSTHSTLWLWQLTRSLIILFMPFLFAKTKLCNIQGLLQRTRVYKMYDIILLYKYCM